MQKSISGREYAKYIFSRNIYLFFLNLKNWAIKKNIQLSDINFVNKNIINILLKKKFLKKKFYKEIKLSKQKYNLSNYLNLPDLIKSPKDLYFFEEINPKATFIGDNCISDIINFSKEIKNLNRYKNKIVLISNADPGFEFYFI